MEVSVRSTLLAVAAVALALPIAARAAPNTPITPLTAPTTRTPTKITTRTTNRTRPSRRSGSRPAPRRVKAPRGWTVPSSAKAAMSQPASASISTTCSSMRGGRSVPPRPYARRNPEPTNELAVRRGRFLQYVAMGELRVTDDLRDRPEAGARHIRRGQTLLPVLSEGSASSAVAQGRLVFRT
jgi:hypothetical protein